jgi:predicted AAA+ superfamily ATPase
MDYYSVFEKKVPFMYITRALEPVVRTYSQQFKVVVVTGPRQVGKTTMLKHLMDEERERGIERSYVTLDNTTLRMAAKEDPALFLQRYQAPILIDEIQYAPELLPFIKILVDESEKKGGFWLTGSQPFHLMRNVSESLAGRAGIIEMLGFSHSELSGVATEPFSPNQSYFTARVSTARKQDVNEVFSLIAKGSLPEIALSETETVTGRFESYVDTYLMRDIRDLTQVGDELRFRRFMAACASLTAKPVAYSELARLADIDEKTAKSWLSILVSSYLIKIVQPYSNNLLKRLSKRPVMHFIDTGLCAHLAGWNNAETLELGAMAGQVFETYAFGEIYKSYRNSGMKPPLFFFRNNDKKEIDLLVEQDGVLNPVEIKKSASPVSRDTRNFSALDPVAASDISRDLQMLKREIGVGCVVCMSDDTFPVNDRAWALPVWAI